MSWYNMVIWRGWPLIVGGRDRQGGPVLTFPPQPDNPDFNSHDITICLKYLLQIPR